MKRIIAITGLLLFAGQLTNAKAQDSTNHATATQDTTGDTPQVTTPSAGSSILKNSVKLNVLALPLKNFSFQYERGITWHFSAALGLRLMPKGSLPFAGAIKKLVDDNDTDARTFVDQARVGNFSFTPEVRWYFGKGWQHGFYVAPYMRYSHLQMEGPYSFDDDGSTRYITFTGTANTVSFGLMVGAQWKLSHRILLDWWIAGADYGSYNVTLNAASDISDLSAEDKQKLQDDLNNTSVNGKPLHATVSNSGVNVKGTTSLPGLRAGLCIGFCF